MLIKIIVEAEWEEQSFRRRIDRTDPSIKFETEPPRLFSVRIQQLAWERGQRRLRRCSNVMPTHITQTNLIEN